MAEPPKEGTVHRPHAARNAGGRRWWRWLRDIGLLVLVFVVIQWWQSRDLVEGPAPPLVGHLLDGSPFQLTATQRPVLVHFWATWCPICRLGQDGIASIAADWPAITIATTSGSADEVAGYLREDGLTMPVLLDENGDIARHWGVYGVPATFIVDGDNMIRYAGMGYATEIGLRLRLWLTRLLHKGGPVAALDG